MKNQIILGDCREVLREVEADSISVCITDPPYNYEFIGHKWDHEEIRRRLDRIKDASTIVKNIPYGSGLAGGVRNANWYKRVRDNSLEYQKWCLSWAKEVFRVSKPGAYVAAFNSTRTMAHVEIALEDAGFYARDCLVFRRHSGIPKGLNIEKALRKQEAVDAERWSGWHSCLRNEWEAILLVQKPLVQNYVTTVTNYGVGLMHAVNPDGSFQSNILEGYSTGRERPSEVHCTVKPLPVIEKLIDLLVPRGVDHVVLDPFAGSGTTLVAAKALGRSYLGIDIVEEYVQIARNRLAESATREQPPVNAKSETLPLFQQETGERRNR